MRFKLLRMHCWKQNCFQKYIETIFIHQFMEWLSEHKTVHNYLCSFNKSISFSEIEEINKTENKLILSDWIQSIDFVVLNTHKISKKFNS